MKKQNNAVWITCPQCQHSWHQEIIETKTIKSDCTCEIDIDLDMFEAPYGGLWVNIFMSSTKELGSFTKDNSKLSLIDYSIA